LAFRKLVSVNDPSKFFPCYQDVPRKTDSCSTEDGSSQTMVTIFHNPLAFRFVGTLEGKLLREDTFLSVTKSGIIGTRRANGAAATVMSNGPDDFDSDLAGQVVTKTQEKTEKPSMYKVLLLNDDYTPMEFVTHVLERFFSKSPEDAHQVMLHVHNHGVGICGVYTYEVAETKVSQVIDFARQCTMEKD